MSLQNRYPAVRICLAPPLQIIDAIRFAPETSYESLPFNQAKWGHMGPHVTASDPDCDRHSRIASAGLYGTVAPVPAHLVGPPGADAACEQGYAIPGIVACDHCGGLVQPRKRGGSRRRFCSTRCRVAKWRANLT